MELTIATDECLRVVEGRCEHVVYFACETPDGGGIYFAPVTRSLERVLEGLIREYGTGAVEEEVTLPAGATLEISEQDYRALLEHDEFLTSLVCYCQPEK